ncbi:hypothetical protein [Mycolicibacterium sphagni]|uniref:hypothetical protein n=1 Tax=Mycolicibacterium sphagni TaxID=1786 RepID=UPI0021F3255E|nr:hypothetical protein [Mycolicibacterium sphagni]MCV7175111.1 hypothetical protein [Mycolicibacterium sphagni]
MPATRVGILARTEVRAGLIAQDLDLRDAVLLWAGASGGRALRGRGRTLDMLIVDDTALPLSHDMVNSLIPCLSESGAGNTYVLQRATDLRALTDAGTAAAP